MPTVVDTVVLHYFLVVDQAQLLVELLDPPIGVPRIVFDPEDHEGIDAVVSELGGTSVMGTRRARGCARRRRGAVPGTPRFTSERRSDRRLAHGHPCERIRRLLIMAAADGLVTEEEANSFHDEMARAGFWDRVRPFPEA